MRVFLPLLLTSFLAGCIVTRVDPEKPELALPSALPAQPGQSAIRRSTR
jgi:hypothetical protein